MRTGASPPAYTTRLAVLAGRSSRDATTGGQVKSTRMTRDVPGGVPATVEGTWARITTCSSAAVRTRPYLGLGWSVSLAGVNYESLHVEKDPGLGVQGHAV